MRNFVHGVLSGLQKSFTELMKECPLCIVIHKRKIRKTTA
jgi:hypothetical protein